MTNENEPRTTSPRTKLFYRYVSRNVAGMIGVSVYILADTFFISVAEGANGIAVLNLALPLYGLLFAIGSMIGIGSATRYALKKAQGQKQIGDYFTHAVLWQILIALPFFLLGVLSPATWLRLMGGDAEIAKLGISYVRILLLGSPFFMMNYSFTAFTRNDNAPTIAMLAALLASGFNILFDYLLMFPIGMGLSGAALATALSPVVSCLICCTHLKISRSNIWFQKTKLSVKRLLHCCKLGISAFVGEMSSAVITTVFNFLLLSSAGTIGVAAYGIVANLSLVAMAIFNGISQGMQPLVSESYGKGDTKTQKKLLFHGVMLTFIVAVVIISASWIFTENLVGIFNSEGNELLAEYSHTALRYYFLGYVFAGVNIVIVAYFSAIGKALYASIASLLRGVAAILICAVCMSIIWGINGIWLSFLAAEGITFVIVLIFWGKMKTKK